MTAAPPYADNRAIREGPPLRRLRILGEFWDFLRHQKKYWLVPIVVILVLMGVFVAFTAQSALAPFIYTLF